MRPCHNDDNTHVEQENWMWPRKLLGCGRLEEVALGARICTVYREVWGPLHNFFLPCLKLLKKWSEGRHWRRRYELPRTASARLRSEGGLTRKGRSQLREFYESLDIQIEAQIGGTIEQDFASQTHLKSRWCSTAGARELRLASSPLCSIYLAV
jgi:hypothetical protein